MNFRRIVLSVLLMMTACLSITMTAAAQPEVPTSTESCDFDLTAVQSMLDEAQAAFDVGDPEGAAALLDAVKTEVEIVRLACQSNRELIETTIGGVLTFGMVEGWVNDLADEDASDDSISFVMAVDDDALQAVSSSPIELTGNQQVIAIRWDGPETIPFVVGNREEITLDTVVQSWVEGLNYGNDTLLTGPEALMVKDWRAQNFKLSVDNSDATVYVVEVERGESYVAFLGYAAKGNLEEVDKVTRTVTETMDYNLISDWLNRRLHRPPLNRRS